MTLNHIAAAFSVLFLILCIVSAITEANLFKSAKIRNFFRSIRINLREIPIPVIFAAAVLPIICSLIFKNPDIAWSIFTAAVFVISAVILDGFRIFGRLNSLKCRKRRKRVGLSRTCLHKKIV